MINTTPCSTAIYHAGRQSVGYQLAEAFAGSNPAIVRRNNVPEWIKDLNERKLISHLNPFIRMINTTIYSVGRPGRVIYKFDSYLPLLSLTCGSSLNGKGTPPTSLSALCTLT
jgi:hypothetical protein